MGNRDHLVPSMTVDRNGHPKTVYVSPSGVGSRASSLSSTAPTLSWVSDDEDEGNGFGLDWEGINDPESWEANEFCADDAQDWSYAGFTADDAYEWRQAGFGFSEAKDWVGTGISNNDVKSWIDAGFDANEAQEWSNFDPDVAAEWRNEGFAATVAGEWSNEGFDSSEATEWHDAGFLSCHEASEWKQAFRGSRRADKDDLVFLFEHGAEADDAPNWLSLLDTVQGLEGGKDETLEGLLNVMEGVNPSAGHEYAHQFPYSHWSILANAGIEFDKVRSVRLAYSKFDENAQDNDGDDYAEDLTGNLVAAVDWIGPAEGLNRQKASVIFTLIGEGTYRPADLGVFLSSQSLINYTHGTEDVLKAQAWAVSAVGEKGPMAEKTKLFETFYAALKDIDGVDKMIDSHGPEKVAEAIQQGMRSEPQLRNYLENISVAGISEGAL